MMKDVLLRNAEKYTLAHKRKRRWQRAVTALSGVVVFCTTYALILPAITMEKKCEIPEHTHTEACYTQVTSREKRVLACKVEADVVVHQHDTACWDGNGSLVCTLPEIELHRHTDSCYTIPEVHTHSEACYTSERGELICTQSTEPQHTHSEDCYQETRNLVCGMPESTGHTHGEECYDGEGNLICGQEESQGHVHGEGCYEVSRQLICGQTEEPAHQHTDECYSLNQVLTCEKSTEAAQPVLTCEKDEIELHTHQPFVSQEDPGCYDAEGKNLVCGKPQVVEHQHTEACFETVEEPVDTEALTCTLPEGETHTHTALCYGTWELTCTLEEHTHSEACTATEPEKAVFCGKEPHTHGESCRDEQGELTCTLDEHTHGLACYADPTADEETAEIWEQTFGDVPLTGNWRLDALAIARSQLGYAESTKNYVLAEDGQTLMGYTRYGAWQGTPYDEWNAPFLAFCLHYAEVEDVPPAGDWGGWATAWPEAFRTPKDYTPAAGDLVLFDRDGDGTADRVAIVAEVTEGGFTAIEGNAEHAVGQRAYETADAAILGYVVLPQGPKEFTLTAQSESRITVTVTGPRESLPCAAREITLAVTEKVDEESRAVRDQLLGEEQAEPGRSFLLDITLRRGEEEIEPVGPVTVTFSGLNTQGLYPKVYHIDTDNQTVKDMEAEKTETGDVAVDTDHFSTYAVSLVEEGALTGTINADTFSKDGVYKLANDVRTAEGINAVTITGNITIDLNGHTLTISKANQFFEVQNGAKLTIMDSSNSIKDSESTAGGNKYGNTATLVNDTLTYYITKSEANDSHTGTTETLEQHTVPLTNAGKILCGATSDQGTSDQLIKVQNGGALELQSGVLQNTGGKHIVSVDGGTLTMEGGYIVGGGSDGNPGGGIYVNNNGTVNISGGVIAANSGTKGGGICINGGSFTMSNGIISGNQTKGSASSGNFDTGFGGGVFALNTTVTISGGYITNNWEDSKCEKDGFGCHGGGGIATMGGSLKMQGGFVTGNYSAEAGGGMYIGHYNYENSATFEMTGGIVAGNVANASEGGGIRVSGKTNGSIQTSNRVYITNNTTNTTFDWGGGGIFVQHNGTLSVVNALITGNTAGGFGGGVGACPTGKTLIVNEQGAAIYRNTADGENMSQGGHNKIYDSAAKDDPVFYDNGHYKDYFCVRDQNGANEPISLVTGLMDGGGAANWTGSCDDHTVRIGKTGYAAANYRFGLDAEPSQEDIDKAVAVTKVIITGNHSNIHGGGIMTNGGLILGKAEKGVEIDAKPELDITGTKALLKDGKAQTSGLDFQFQLRNKPLSDTTEANVTTVTANGTTGEFTFSDIVFNKEGTYTYYLSEVNGNRIGVDYDNKEYTIVVKVGKKSFELLEVPFISYYVESVTVDGKEVGDSSGSGSGTGSQTGTFRVRYQNTKGWDKVNVYVWEVTNGGSREIAGGWPGTAMAKESDDIWYYDLTVTGTGTYNYIFNDGTINDPKVDENKTNNIMSVSYAPNKEVLFEYDQVKNNTATTASTETGGVARGSNPDGSYTLVMEGPTFTNTMTTRLDLQIVKTDSVSGSKLQNATFTLTNAETVDKLEEATTDENGIATFENILRGATYYLRETQAPTNHMVAGPWILEVETDGNAKLYPATVTADGKLVKTSGTDTGTVLAVADGTDSKVLVLPIQDTPWGYELPETGGAGTTSYTAGGLVLMFSGAVLLYIHSKGRKGEKASS